MAPYGVSLDSNQWSRNNQRDIRTLLLYECLNSVPSSVSMHRLKARITNSVLMGNTGLQADAVTVIAVMAGFVVVLMIAVALTVCHRYFCNKCRSCRNSCREYRRFLRRGRTCDIDQQLCYGSGAEAAWNDGILWTAGRKYAYWTDVCVRGFCSVVRNCWFGEIVMRSCENSHRSIRFQILGLTHPRFEMW